MCIKAGLELNTEHSVNFYFQRQSESDYSHRYKKTLPKNLKFWPPPPFSPHLLITDSETCQDRSIYCISLKRPGMRETMEDNGSSTPPPPPPHTHTPKSAYTQPTRTLCLFQGQPWGILCMMGWSTAAPPPPPPILPSPSTILNSCEG